MTQIDNTPQPPVEVPPSALSEDTLNAVIESFILREGTDYGRQEMEYETKANQVIKQINRGHVRIVFDPNTESINLLTDQEWKKLSRSDLINTKSRRNEEGVR